ncbi:MAG TPA: Gfo/Idh/MocA family oxidoreductase [Thermoguttaceae bacterium]|nr:Gfo/Idh/MocA family oxidoreductase [Thermoguttaceae bacterium]
MSPRDPQQQTERPTRRDFLKTSGVLAGAALAGNLAVARTAHAAGSDTLKLGLIGCGNRGTGAARDAMDADPNVRLVAMGDLFEEKVQTKRKLLQQLKPSQVAVDDDHCFVGFDAYQSVIDSGVDVVILGEVPHYRPKHLAAAIAAGKHVFCEKPVAVDAPGVRSVLESTKLAEQKKLSLVSGLCWRYHPAVQETMQRVADGEIGQIRNIQETYLFGLVGNITDRRPGMTEMEFQARNWWYFTWLSGDHNVEQHVHSLDKALWAMGDEPPVAAWATGGRQVPNFGAKPKTGDTYDHFAVVYEYPDEVTVNAYCRQQANCYREVVDRIIGTKGTARIVDAQSQQIFDLDGKRTWRYRSRARRKPNMYQLEHEALFKAIRSGEPVNNGQYAAYSTMMAIMGRMCAYTGQRITWEDAINSDESLAPSAYSFDADPPTRPDAEGKYPIAIPGVTKFA